ncbi:NADH-ubiquinone dehydrogenase [Sarcoptes scabiei]|nr:NADH-ubiquinone dehydrogenase [Sarcoptes scabiei]
MIESRSRKIWMMPRPTAASDSILERMSHFEQTRSFKQPSNNDKNYNKKHDDDNDIHQSLAESETDPMHSNIAKSMKNSIDDHSDADNFSKRFLAAFKSYQERFSDENLESSFMNFDIDWNVNSFDQVKKLLVDQQKQIIEFERKLSRLKFTAQFLEKFLNNDFYNEINNKNEKFTSNSGLVVNDDSNNQSKNQTTNNETKEQYVTVITLNDSAYGEIQKVSPQKSSDPIENTETDDGESDESNTSEEQLSYSNSDLAKERPEPIYSNTLEAQTIEKGSRKRPPTPPKKPKLPTNKSVEICFSKNFLSQSCSKNCVNKSQNKRSFTGPLQKYESDSSENSNDVKKTVKNSPTSQIRKELDQNKTNFLRTFSVVNNLTENSKSGKKSDKKSTDESSQSIDDNIYDTVAPDSECDKIQKRLEAVQSNDEEEIERDETSSQEMLSRSSSTDELSNYVNIDYFLRKNSLGRSNSNIPSRLGRKSMAHHTNLDESDESEMQLSSIKSATELDHFGSTDNILHTFQQRNPKQSNSMRSFNSSSSSSGGSSLRLKRNHENANREMCNFLNDFYSPNLSTFTPPIRDKSHTEFFSGKDYSLNECMISGSSVFTEEPEIVASKSSPLEKSICSEVDFYAYTDIIGKNDDKLNIQEESICLEDKSISDFDQGPKSSTLLAKNDGEHSDKKTSPSKQESRNFQQMQFNIVRSIIDSETIYLDCLNTLNKYKKAFETAAQGEKALISMEDLSIIFFRIPELYDLHNSFLIGLKKVDQYFRSLNFQSNNNNANDYTNRSAVKPLLIKPPISSSRSQSPKMMPSQSIGELFQRLAEKLFIYSDFLRNYSKAIETANRCGANNIRFYEIIKSIKIASPNGQFSNLVDLLHEPVARLQKNALVLYDLLKYTENENEQKLLKNALRLNQKFLNDLNLDAARRLFMTHDKFKRRLVKESFIIESGDRRKLRHLFLFNDVIVSAKYKASSRQKFTFELRWFQMLNDIVLDPVNTSLHLNTSQPSASISDISHHSNIHIQNNGNNHPQNTASVVGFNHNTNIQQNNFDKESKECVNLANSISNLKSRAFSLHLDLYLEEKRKGQSKQSDRLRKKISELESELVLYLPQLRFSFRSKSNSNKSFVFYLSSEYERNCWIDAIKTLQQNASSDEHANVHVLQKWIESCRKSINVNLGSFLLRTTKDETLRYGDLHMRIIELERFMKQTNLFIVIETDCYGHYCRRAVARFLASDSHLKHQEFLIELEGSQILRFLLYEEFRKADEEIISNDNSNPSSVDKTVLKGKAILDLTAICWTQEPKLSEIQLNDFTLCFETRYIPWTSIMEMIPPNKLYGTFGININQVCKKEKSQVPYLILSCINEVERRGLKEVGIYRVSGLSSEVQKLKKAFETNPRDACYLIREIDIHSVTGLLKLYLRELPESLFTNDMYQKYFEARDLKNSEEKEMQMTSLLSQLVEPNQSTIIKLIEHLVLVNRFEDDNKMSLNNLATVFGPTMLRTNSSGSSNGQKNSNSASNHQIQNYGNSNINANLGPLMINTDLFTASTIDVMAQADILYFFLRRKSDGLSLTSIEHEETSL